MTVIPAWAPREACTDGWKKKRAACEEAAAAGDPLQQFTAEPNKGHLLLLADFVKEIRGERGPACPVQDAVLATRVCLAAAKSYMENRSVELSEIAANS